VNLYWAAAAEAPASNIW